MEPVTPAACRVRLTYPVDALVSYHYYRDDEPMAALVSTGRLTLIGDSGAYSAWSQGATITLDEYAAWCHRWRDHLCWCAGLDVIGDPQATWRNWTNLRERHQLLTVPTLHAGADTSWLDAYAAQGVDLIGLGGMAATGQAPRAYRWVVHVMRYARRHHPQVRFHLWGVTNRRFLETLPVWSADSSGTLGAGYRYGEMRLFDPANGRHLRLRLRRGSGSRDMYQHGQLLRRVYGVDPALIETSHPGNRTILVQLAAAATQQWAAWLQRRHQVSAPSMYRARPASGPRVHMGLEGNPAQHSDTERMLGPRVNLVSSAAGGSTDDLETAVTGQTRRRTTGPQLHVADTGPSLRDVTHEPEGPRYHVVEGSPQTLLAVTDQDQEGTT